MIGIFGGMFDPVHFGHLRPALEVLENLQLDKLHFVPCAQPPHRAAAVTSAALRCELLQAAINDQPGFVLDKREIQRDGPSYTIDTLIAFRDEYPQAPLCLLLGMDAFLRLPQWHRWQELLDYAHLVVMHRPDVEMVMDEPLTALCKTARVNTKKALSDSRAGCIYFQAVTQIDLSSTAIRDFVSRNKSLRYLMPEAVRQIIDNKQLYN